MSHCHSEEAFGKRHPMQVKFLQDGPTQLNGSSGSLVSIKLVTAPEKFVHPQLSGHCSLSSFIFKTIQV